jgi:hypothetical protein
LASDGAIGAVYSQKHEDGLHPVVYFPRKITSAELNYDIYDKELLAIVEALREWRVYLQGANFPVTILIDYKNLIYFTITKDLNRQ